MFFNSDASLRKSGHSNSKMQHKIAIIGCGLIGRKRAAALAGGQLVMACDLDESRARALAAAVPGCVATANPADVFSGDAEIVVISTLNNALAPLALAAAQAGKHVLVEKPAARTVAELLQVRDAARKSGVMVRVGYNHRYHPALQKARELVDAGSVGELMFVRGRYGHGGRVGYDREWRANPELSGGGELIDQGVHLIDLAGWFLGSFSKVEGHATTSFWDMPVDDNAFMSLRTDNGQTAWLHASCSEWKNLFSFEIYGRTGKLHIEGLGGSYGVERLTFYKMLPEMGPPETSAWEFPRGDRSWELEMAEFLEDVRRTRDPEPGISEALDTLRIVEKIYAQSEE
jgi:predicted dehydrogenase